MLVNVDVTSSSFSNGSINYTGGASAANTIFNFGATTALSTSSIGFNGSIRASLATSTWLSLLTRLIALVGFHKRRLKCAKVKMYTK